MHIEDNKRITTFREKMAWVMVFALSLSAGLYFFVAWNMSVAMDAVPKSAMIAITAIFVIALTLIAVIGSIGAALSNVDEADIAMDERDKIISLNALRGSSITTAIILILTMVAYFFGARSSDMLLGIMAALICGHLVDYLSQIYLYRRRA